MGQTKQQAASANMKNLGFILPPAALRCMSSVMRVLRAFLDMVRDSIHEEFASNRWFYLQCGRSLGVFDEETVAEDLTRDIQKALNPKTYLSGNHILALSNALRRPILLLTGGTAADQENYGHLYCPIRHPPGHCMVDIANADETTVRRMPSPLVLGCSSNVHNHYIACLMDSSTDVDVPFGQVFGNRPVHSQVIFPDRVDSLRPLLGSLIRVLARQPENKTTLIKLLGNTTTNPLDRKYCKLLRTDATVQ
jgi:hypothetical protein